MDELHVLILSQNQKNNNIKRNEDFFFCSEILKKGNNLKSIIEEIVLHKHYYIFYLFRYKVITIFYTILVPFFFCIFDF